MDWFHLVENLHKVGGSGRALATVEACLWVGNVEAAIEQFKHWRHERANLFVAYLTEHRHRIVNYSYFQAEGLSIGSGSVESAVKQIGARIKLSGTQWKGCCSVVPISTDSSPSETYKTGMHSCGHGVPLYDYQGDRETLIRWAEKKGEEGLQQYWQEKSQVSIDGLPTYLLSETDLVE